MGTNQKRRSNEGENTFVRVTNSDIFRKVNEVAVAQDEIMAKLQVHDNKIQALQKMVYGIIGGLSTIGVGVFIFILTQHPFG